MITTRVALISLVLLGLATSSFAAGHGLAMWSIRDRNGSWKFVFLQDRDDTRSWTEKEILEAPSISGFNALKEYLKKLPRDTSIMWRDFPPSKEIILPRPSVISEIVEYGKRQGLHLECWPTIVD